MLAGDHELAGGDLQGRAAPRRRLPRQGRGAPAAAGYRERLQADGTFNGLTLTSKSQASTLLANPALNIHHGELLTCVWREPTAACRQGDQDQPDITRARARIKDLAAGAQAMPAPLRQRAEERITRLQGVIDAHEASRPRTEAL